MSAEILCALTLAGGLAAGEATGRQVFAHYMVCFAALDRGHEVADYMREIELAQRYGIDGFALNCGGWSKREPHYKQRVTRLYEAAKRLNSGFKLLISADYCCGLTHEETQDMIESFRDHPNQFRHQGKPVLSTFAGEGADNTAGKQLIAFLDQLTPQGRPVVFVPYFYPRPNITELPRQAHADQLLRDFSTLDGYFYFGAAGSGQAIADSNRLLARTWLGAGKLFMASLTPYYRGLGGNYRCFETLGFRGLAAQWQAAIETGATWVEIVTWNDWGEATYVAPFEQPERLTKLSYHGQELPAHNGYLEASRYWLDWYKRGTAPAIEQDKLCYCYRLHPKTVAGHIKPGEAKLGRPGGAERLEDKVFVTAFLTAPAELTIECGPARGTFALAAGVQHVELPFAPGTPRFVLRRDGHAVIDKAGEQSIRADEAVGNFNTFAGSATAAGR